MINLLPWREKLHWRKKCGFISFVLLLFSLLGCIMLYVSVGATVRLSQLNQQKSKLEKTVAVLAREDEIFNKQRIKVRALEHTHNIIQQRFAYLQQFIQVTEKIKSPLVLQELHCIKLSCDMTIASSVASALTQQFKVSDIKQGECPLCYRARVKLSL